MNHHVTFQCFLPSTCSLVSSWQSSGISTQRTTTCLLCLRALLCDLISRACPCQKRTTEVHGCPVLSWRMRKRTRHSSRWSGQLDLICTSPFGLSLAEESPLWPAKPEPNTQINNYVLFMSLLGFRQLYIKCGMLNMDELALLQHRVKRGGNLVNSQLSYKSFKKVFMIYLCLHYRGFTNPPFLWRASQCPYCGILSQWQRRQSGKRSSSPTAWQPCGSLPGQEGTWSWWEARLTDGCNQHTEERPWSEALCHRFSAFCRHFSVRVDKNNKTFRCVHSFSTFLV